MANAECNNKVFFFCFFFLLYFLFLFIYHFKYHVILLQMLVKHHLVSRRTHIPTWILTAANQRPMSALSPLLRLHLATHNQAMKMMVKRKLYSKKKTNVLSKLNEKLKKKKKSTLRILFSIDVFLKQFCKTFIFSFTLSIYLSHVRLQ